MIPLKAGGWTGMRYSRWSGQADPSLAFFAYDMYVDAAGPGSAYRSRPGRYRVSSTQLGSGGQGQLVHQFTKLDGTQYTIAIAGGKFYTLDWSTGTWTEVLTASDFSSASITLSTTARCYAVTFNNTVVISDGTNVPWTWDGTTNGGLTKLTNAPVAYGQPTVYAAKLFFIKNTARGTIVWSEEAAANTGYEASGYSNVWLLGQVQQEPLTAIRGTNDGLYYWRHYSVGVIRGAVNTDFTTSATHDAVSTRVGCRSPRGVLYYNNTFYFPDQFGRPCAYQPGGEVTPLWEQVTLAYPMDTGDDSTITALGSEIGVSANDLLAMETVPVSALGGVFFACSPVGNTGDDSHGGWYVGANGRIHGFWFWGASNLVGVGASGEVINSQTNLPEVLQVEETGYTYAFGKRDVWYDEPADGTDTPVSVSLIGPRQGATDSVELHFTKLDVVLDTRTVASLNANADLLTSRLPVPSSAQQATVTTASTVQEKRVSYGFDRGGRWAHVYLILSLSSGTALPHAIHGYTLWATPDGDDPNVP